MYPVNSIKIKFDPLRSISFADVTTSYVMIGTPFQNPGRMIKIWNNTDADCFLSQNGIDDNDFLPSKGGFVYDYASNKSNQGGTLEQPANDRWYIKAESGLPSTGAIYVTFIYATAV